MPFWAHLLLTIVVRIGMYSDVGMNVMHDGNHGCHIQTNHGLATNSWAERYTAGNVYNWQVQHNVLPYHQYSGHDES
jgi:linoleoyl-CoA desaturase